MFLCYSPEPGIQRGLAVSSRIDDNLPKTLYRETSTPKTSCLPFYSDSHCRHLGGLLRPRGSHSAAAPSTGPNVQGWGIATPSAGPWSWEQIAWETALCRPVLQARFSLDKPGTVLLAAGLNYAFSNKVWTSSLKREFHSEFVPPWTLFFSPRVPHSIFISVIVILLS